MKLSNVQVLTKPGFPLQQYVHSQASSAYNTYNAPIQTQQYKIAIKLRKGKIEKMCVRWIKQKLLIVSTEYYQMLTLKGVIFQAWHSEGGKNGVKPIPRKLLSSFIWRWYILAYFRCILYLTAWKRSKFAWYSSPGWRTSTLDASLATLMNKTCWCGLEMLWYHFFDFDTISIRYWRDIAISIFSK